MNFSRVLSYELQVNLPDGNSELITQNSKLFYAASSSSFSPGLLKSTVVSPFFWARSKAAWA